MFSECKIETDPKKTEAVSNWKTPTSEHEVRFFLGFASYFRKFVPVFFTKAGPLHSLLEKKIGKRDKRNKTKKPMARKHEIVIQNPLDRMSALVKNGMCSVIKHLKS